MKGEVIDLLLLLLLRKTVSMLFGKGMSGKKAVPFSLGPDRGASS